MGLLPHQLSLSTTEETDFSPVTLDVVFDQDTTTGRECFFITIVDDDVLEESETFQVTLQPRINTTIDFVESLLIVTIIDDDSKSSYNGYFLYRNSFQCVLFNVTI